MSLTRFFVSRPALAFVVIILVAIIGTASAFTLVQEQFPVVDLPVVSVEFTYVGASTSEMRDAIVRPIEDAIAGAPDLDYLNSSVQQGQAVISATFTLASDKNTDLIEVQRRVQSALSLIPSDVRSPVIEVFDPSQSIVMSLVVSSASLPAYQLASIVKNRLVPDLEQIPGISRADAQGSFVPSMMVTVDPLRLAGTNATLNDVINAVSQNNARAPGGYVTANGKETSLDVRGDIQTTDNVADLLLPITTTAPAASPLNAFTSSAQLLHVFDVAAVAEGYEPPRSFAFERTRPSISIDMIKTSGASEVTSSDAVVKALPKLRAAYPQLQFDVAEVQSDYTRSQLTGVIHALIEGIVLTGLAMLFFLRSWRNAVVVMIAIPVSLGVTLGAMKLAGFTIDVVSLLGMTLIIGILVDDSIVVLENTDRRHEAGEPPRLAALRGREEIGLAAVVITLVDVVVFAPIAFLPGIVGRFLNEFGLVVVTATLSSLAVSFTVTPALAGNWSLKSQWKPPGFIDAFTRTFERLRTWYGTRALRWGLTHPWPVIGIAFLSLVGAIALLPLGLVGFEFLPSFDRGDLAIQLSFPSGTAIGTTRDLTVKVERYIDGIGSDLQSETAVAGGTTSQTGDTVQEGSRAQISVALSDGRAHSTAYWTAEFQREIARIVPQAQVLVIPATGTNGGVVQPIDYVVKAGGGGDPAQAAARVTAVMRQTPGVLNVVSGAADMSPQIEVEFHRDAARVANVSLSTAAAALRAAFGGDTVTQYISPLGLEDVTVIYPIANQTDVATLRSIRLRSNSGTIVHLGDIADLRALPAPALLTRQNRQTVIHISSNIAPGAIQSNVTKVFERRVKALNLPANISVAPNAGGDQQNLQDTVTGIGAALVFAISLVYLLMVALFNSYRSPAIILFSVPVAVVGALGGLALTHQTLNMFSMIGTVLLIGLVSKNGILLVDFANRARARGLTRTAAITEAASVRFRPILMTTIAMISGMLPIALAVDPGSETRRALGVVVIGGLSSSLILTLLLVPIIYVRFAPRTTLSTIIDGEDAT